MKKALTICLITVLCLGLVAGATCCGILFSNEQILFNALNHNSEQLTVYYEKAYNKLSNNSYFDFSFTNSSNTTKSSNLKVYLDSDNIIVSKLTLNDNNSNIIYDYEGNKTDSVVYCNDNGIKSIAMAVAFEDVVMSAVDLTDDVVYSIDEFAIKLCQLFNKDSFNKLNFQTYLNETKPVFDIKNKIIGVYYVLTFIDNTGNSIFKVNTIVDKDYNFRDISILISGNTFNMKINSTNTISTLSRKNIEEAREYSGSDTDFLFL